MGEIYGYCRCSTNETKQDITRQERELNLKISFNQTLLKTMNLFYKSTTIKVKFKSFWYVVLEIKIKYKSPI